MMDRYIIYHNRPRVITPVLSWEDLSVNDYRRGTNASSGMNFDYRREFYARAEQSYRVAGGAAAAYFLLFGRFFTTFSPNTGAF